MKRMTLKEIEELPGEYLLPKHIAAVLDCDQYTVNCAAQTEPDKLGFPVIVTGARVRIPKAGFIHFMKYGKPSSDPPDRWVERCRDEVLSTLRGGGHSA